MIYAKDGLDEFRTFNKEDVNIAARIAVDPKKEINIRTLVAGILTKKILNGKKYIMKFIC